MGTSRWDASDWAGYSKTTSTKTTREIFRSCGMDEDLNPMGINRESRDSDLNPESTAVIVACDVTGSMGMLADTLIREGLGTLFGEILDRKPVSDPHVMAMAIGDATMYDTAPLQVSQFEADLTIAKQLEKVYIEGGGGGNNFESYDLPMYFAAYHTSIDCFEKRGKKGYLFTLGDEKAPPCTTRASVEKFIGDDGLQDDIPMKDVIAAAEKMYNVYHIIVAEGYYASNHLEEVKHSWREVIGQNAIVLTDYTKLAEVIVSVMQVNEGHDADEVVDSWSGDTSMVVKAAVSDLAAKADAFDAASDVTRF